VRKPDASTAVAAKYPDTKGLRRAGQQALPCGWCAGPIVLAPTGRTPSWCSATCRHRAWETRRAAAAGRLAVEVVDRVVEVERTVTVVQTVEVSALPKGASWASALLELADQIGAGKVYDRDLPALAASVNAIITALNRRPGMRRVK
jgi:hypothetical protein